MKKGIIGFIAIAPVMFTSSAHAADLMETLQSMSLWLTPMLQGFVVKWPVLSVVILVVGTLRLCIKPVMELLKIYVAATPSVNDDALPSKVEGSKPYKFAMFLLDWIASLKKI